MSVVTRFAPSPTGLLHVGGARTALFCGLDADEGPYYQTQRFDRYREIIRGMLQAGSAYHCYCTKQELDALREQQIARKEKPRYPGICRERREPRPGIDPVVRFRNPVDG